MSLYKDILKEALDIIQSESSAKDKMQVICDLLEDQIEHYDWVGFYLSDVERRLLHLGPYTGEKTDHTTIPYGKGICGQAAETEKTFLIDDVSAESNYISCSIHINSEIVVPIKKEGIVVGHIDIDSDKVAAFTAADQELLENICAELAPYI
jgi:L-methionine (R)-S-oxide reductase